MLRAQRRSLWPSHIFKIPVCIGPDRNGLRFIPQHSRPQIHKITFFKRTCYPFTKRASFKVVASPTRKTPTSSSMFNLHPAKSTSSPRRLTCIEKLIVLVPGRNASQACVSRSPWTPAVARFCKNVYYESENTKNDFRKTEKEESMTGLTVHFGSRTPHHSRHLATQAGATTRTPAGRVLLFSRH